MTINTMGVTNASASAACRVLIFTMAPFVVKALDARKV
jgi:hypothetical protein